jgi:hypothetical protein
MGAKFIGNAAPKTTTFSFESIRISFIYWKSLDFDIWSGQSVWLLLYSRRIRAVKEILV